MAIVKLFSSMKKRILTFLSMFVLIGINAWADTDLASLISQASSGGEVKLTEDVTLTKTITIDKNLTLDMAGHTITATNCRAFQITKGDVVIKNTGGGYKRITSTHDADNTTFDEESSVIRIGDGSSKNDYTETNRTRVSLTIDTNVEVYTAYCYGISVFGSKTKETLIVNGKVTVAGNYSAIAGNGLPYFTGTTINIGKDAVITATKANAIYQPQGGELNVYGKVGATGNKGGIEAKSGTINIYDGAKVYGSSKTQTHTANSNGCSTTGYAIAVVNNKSYTGCTKVNINNSSGEVSYNVAILDDSGDVPDTKKGSICITSGCFKNCTIEESFLAEGKKLVKGKSVSRVVDTSTEIVATIGTSYSYISLDDAVSDWKSNTLTLQKDVEFRPYSINGKTVTLDLNGHQWKAIYSEKQTATTCAFQIFTSSNSMLTINDSKGNGSIVCGDNMSEAIWMGNSGASYNNRTATLIVNGGKLQGKYYAIAGNGSWKGITNITINGGELGGEVAIYHPQNNGTLTITGGTITGDATALEIRAGKEINISGGKFSSTATAKKVEANGSGTTTSGYALAVSQHTTKLPINVNITGGEFEGYTAFGVVNPQNNETENVNITVADGTFKATATEGGEALYMGHKGGTVNVTGGKFTGTVTKAEGANLYLLGGSYSVEPTNGVLAKGFSVSSNDSETDKSSYPYKVEFKKVETTVDESVTYKDAEGNDISEADKTNVENAVTETVTENTAVNDNTPNTDTAISENDKTELNNLLAEAAGLKTEEETTTTINKVETGLSINLTSASVSKQEDQDNTYQVTKMVFDIKPVAVAYDSNNKPLASVTVPNSLISNKIKFRLPIDKSTTAKYASISHQADESQTEDDLGLFEIQTLSGSSDKYIELERDNFSIYAVSLSNATSVMTAYKGNSESITVAMDATSWSKILKDCPNAVAVVPSENAKFTNGNNVKNVIVEYTAGSTKAYECPNFALTDLKDFYSPYDFIALSGSYSRTSNNISTDGKSYNSVCLPFAIKATDLSNTAQILTFSYYDAGNKTVGFTKATGQISAGTPCLVLEGSNVAWTVNFENTKITCTPNNSGNMKGTFTLTSEYANNTNYLSVNTDNKFQKLASTLSPFRSCLYLDKDNNIGLDSNSKMNIVVLDETTGIKNVGNTAVSDGNFYSLNGVKLGTSFDKLPKGIYLYGGKKIVKK